MYRYASAGAARNRGKLESRTVLRKNSIIYDTCRYRTSQKTREISSSSRIDVSAAETRRRRNHVYSCMCTIHVLCDWWKKILRKKNFKRIDIISLFVYTIIIAAVLIINRFRNNITTTTGKKITLKACTIYYIIASRGRSCRARHWCCIIYNIVETFWVRSNSRMHSRTVRFEPFGPTSGPISCTRAYIMYSTPVTIIRYMYLRRLFNFGIRKNRKNKNEIWKLFHGACARRV